MPNISTEHFLDGIITGPECKENKDFSLCFGAVFTLPQLTSFSSVLSNSPFHRSTQKPSRQDHTSWIIVSQTIKSLLPFVSWLWVLEDSSQKCPKVQNMHSNWLCISVPSPAPISPVGSHRFVPDHQIYHQIKKYGSVLAGDPPNTAV